MPKNERCPHCRSTHLEKHGHRTLKTAGRIQRYRCLNCTRTWSDRTNTIMHGLRTNPEKVGSALHARTEGVGLRATGRLIGTNEDTISFWEKRLAANDDDEERRSLEQLSAALTSTVEMDCFYTKVHHNRPAFESQGWTTLALERTTHVMLALEPGTDDRIRDAVSRVTRAVTADLRIVSDGDPRFGLALLEQRGEPFFSGRRGRPPRVLREGYEAVMKIKGAQSSKRKGARVRPVRTHPATRPLADAEVHANHCEATNAMLRRRCSAYRRRTNCYAKTRPGLRRACAVQRAVHNYVRPHPGLARGVTPAMAAGWCDRRLSFVELVMR
jgi:transposase-like protein